VGDRGHTELKNGKANNASKSTYMKLTNLKV